MSILSILSSMQPYSKTNMFLSEITERYSLCSSASQKSVMHVALSLKDSQLSYLVGDSIAVAAINDPELVQKTLRAVRCKEDFSIVDKSGTNTYSIGDFLTRKANLADVSKRLISEICKRQSNSAKKERLEFLLQDDQKDVLKEYQLSHEVWDALEENEEAHFTPQELCHLLMPLLPRFYSIASAQDHVGEEVHLTVAELVYETNGHQRRGVATHYLCKLAPLNQKIVPIYVQPSNGFTLPENGDAPIIMIGPGTGVAPYRGFMQERVLKGATGGNWLFFGEWHVADQYYYAEYWHKLVGEGHLRLSTAFSRDQENKIYVQHRMAEQGKDFFDWLEKGAYVYVCGDARRMAKDVDLALHQIVQTHGRLTEESTKDYIKALKAAKRYLRDVY